MTVDDLEPVPTEIERPSREVAYTRRGSLTFLRISVGVFLAGFSAFSLLFCVQPLLPLFSADFGVSPAESALALSFTAAVLAVSVLVMAAVAVGFERRTLMFVSMLSASLLTIGQVFAPSWHAFLAMRALEGIAIAGVPTVVLAYLAEEIDPKGLGFSVGLYIAGNGIGGMVGRLGASAMAGAASWRASMAMMGTVTFVFALAFILLMPRSRNFTPHRGTSISYHWGAWLSHAKQPEMRRLMILGFIAMGSFVCVYNYVAFRLAAPPYGMSQIKIGLIFLVYIFGVIASPIAGAALDKYGRPRVLTVGLLTMTAGIGVTLARPMSVIIAGIAILTVGFFIVQPVLNSWPGRIAKETKGHATSVYLVAWYGGAALVGLFGGHAYSWGGWSALAALLVSMILIALATLWWPDGRLRSPQ